MIVVVLEKDQLIQILKQSYREAVEESKLGKQACDSIQTTDDERFLSTDEVAKLLNVSSVTIWAWEKRGILTSYRIGNLKRFKYFEVLNAPRKILRSK